MVTREEFNKALNDYIADNYNEQTLQVMLGFQPESGVDFDPKAPGALYRGIFIAEPTASQLQAQEGATFGSWFWEDKQPVSWTRDLNDAYIFAKGSNIYEQDDSEISDGSLGLILVPQMSHSIKENILVDLDYAAAHSNMSLDIVEGNEVIMRPVACRIYKRITSEDTNSI